MPRASIGVSHPSPGTSGRCQSAVTGRHRPAVSADGRFVLWLFGDIYDCADRVRVGEPRASRTPGFRDELLGCMIADGAELVRLCDGEYQIVLWDGQQRTLTVANDRFGSLPLYWARPAAGVAFGSAVRGVLCAPGVPAEADPEALREAVTFGGYRLGNRTNVKAVRMVPAATVTRVSPGGAPVEERYWRWSALPGTVVACVDEAVDRVTALWKEAMRRRLGTGERHSQTLSGGGQPGHPGGSRTSNGAMDIAVIFSALAAPIVLTIYGEGWREVIRLLPFAMALGAAAALAQTANTLLLSRQRV